MELDIFTEKLASSAPTPGGGGAAAAVASIATALAHMSLALGAGKPKYTDDEAEMRSLMSSLDAMRTEFLALIDADAAAFLPLAAAYKSSDPEQKETALRNAAEPPMRIMELCAQALPLISGAYEICPRLALSDAGCAAVCCRAALSAASLNVYANTSQMKDKQTAAELNARAAKLLESTCIADALYFAVRSALGGD